MGSRSAEGREQFWGCLPHSKALEIFAAVYAKTNGSGASKILGVRKHGWDMERSGRGPPVAIKILHFGSF